jgi:hypothetical protein
VRVAEFPSAKALSLFSVVRFADGLTHMKRIALSLSFGLILPLITAVYSQSNKPLKAVEEVVPVNGFRTEGGLANIVEGDAIREREGKVTQFSTLNFIADGDTIEAGANGHVELLLNPGTYLRLAPGTRITFIDLSPDNMKLRLSKGSAILETLISQFEFKFSSADTVRGRFNGSYQGISMLTPDGEFVTAKGGIYRCDIDEYARSRLKVVKGVAVTAGSIITEGKMAPLGDRVPAVAAFDRKQEDGFDTWSHRRATGLVQLNKSLTSTSWYHQLKKHPRAYVTITYDESSERLKERLLVSAIGGYVGYAENGAMFQRAGAGWQPLTKDAELQFGDRVETGPDARVEIRLYPSCYLMLSTDTEIVYGSRPDGGAAITVLRGAAIIAAGLPVKDGLVISFVASAEIEIPGKSFCRLNVARGETELLVYEGKVSIAGRVVEGGNRVVFSGDDPQVGPTRRRDLDAFELWSRKRSALLLNDPSRFKHAPFDFPNAHRASFFGLWCLVPDAEGYTFVPTGVGLESPYGGSYSIGFAGRVK